MQKKKQTRALLVRLTAAQKRHLELLRDATHEGADAAIWHPRQWHPWTHKGTPFNAALALLAWSEMVNDRGEDMPGSGVLWVENCCANTRAGAAHLLRRGAQEEWSMGRAKQGDDLALLAREVATINHAPRPIPAPEDTQRRHQ